MNENKTAFLNTRIKPSTKDDFDKLCKVLKLSQSELVENMTSEKMQALKLRSDRK